MLAREIMTPNPRVVTTDEPLAHAAAIMRDLDVGIVPVVNDRVKLRLEGVITDRDIAVRCVAAQHGTHCRVRDHMTADRLDTVRPDAPLADVIELMERDRVRRIVVVGQDERVVGIIAQADLAVRLGAKEPLKVEEVLERVSQSVYAAH
jgi:CBS domain-containing protein